jgi:nucleotide-binding universal stress UspA family protein
MPLRELVQNKPVAGEDAIEKEAGKGYSIAFAGIERPISPNATRFDPELKRLIDSFEGPVAITVNGTGAALGLGAPLNILVPTRGTPEARLATEIALSLAKASGGALTVLHVFDPNEDLDLLRGRTRRQGMSFLVDARRLGKRSGVSVKGLTATNARPVAEILQAARERRYDLVVLGTTMQRGDIKFIGPHATALVRTLRVPVLFIAC